jgi:L-ascorbate 6-phosphate lactonase
MTMSQLAAAIAARSVPKGSLAIYWLCQAGFVFKSSDGRIVYIDPYLTDAVERVVGFKRMMSSPIAPSEVVADLVICTHEHLDHMDTDALPVIAQTSRTHFAGPTECFKYFEELRIPPERRHLLQEGQSVVMGDLTIKGVYADHGDLSPCALGVVLDFDGIRVYHTGDTAYRPEQFRPAIETRPDILLPCINGAFGNMDAREAAQLAQLTAPSLVFPTHFWLFVEQNGNPKHFLELCSQLAPGVAAPLLKPGEEYLFRKAI